MKKFLLCIFIANLALVSCQEKGPEQEFEFFENGTIKSISELKNGIPHGKSYVFHENGKPKSIYEWKGGELDGEMTTFFEDGTLKEKSHYKMGLLPGLLLDYHKSGQLRKRATYVNGRTIGETIFFRKDGSLHQIQTHNNSGELIYTFHRFMDGTKWSTPIPQFQDEEDTVALGNYYKTKVSFGYKLSGELQMIVGTIDKTGSVTDTFEVVKPINGSFYYSERTTKLGQNVLKVKFLHKPIKNDTLTLTVDQIGTSHPYYVKENANNGFALNFSR